MCPTKDDNDELEDINDLVKIEQGETNWRSGAGIFVNPGMVKFVYAGDKKKILGSGLYTMLTNRIFPSRSGFKVVEVDARLRTAEVKTTAPARDGVKMQIHFHVFYAVKVPREDVLKVVDPVDSLQKYAADAAMIAIKEWASDDILNTNGKNNGATVHERICQNIRLRLLPWAPVTLGLEISAVAIEALDVAITV